MGPAVKIVIGANYGDEGKGLATHYFTTQSEGKCLNVLFNGGAQRGHTVEYKNGPRYVFHHFGAGTFDGADTYFARDFMLNPMIFADELSVVDEASMRYAFINPVCEVKTFVSPKCRVTTPWDCMINQIVESSRGESKHGSCGLGIWETQRRYEDWIFSLTYFALSQMSDKNLKEHLINIRDNYAISRLKDAYGIDEIPEKFKKTWYDDRLLKRYISDFHTMREYLIMTDSLGDIADKYDTIIFEGGQGLALDEDNMAARPYVTASATGSKVPLEMVKDISSDIEVVYVTRPYFTRHGAGPFPTECPKDYINPNICDPTNRPNSYQGTLRFGFFDCDELLGRVETDLNKSYIPDQRVSISLFITQYNLRDRSGNFLKDLREISRQFNYLYLSNAPYLEEDGAVVANKMLY